MYEAPQSDNLFQDFVVQVSAESFMACEFLKDFYILPYLDIFPSIQQSDSSSVPDTLKFVETVAGIAPPTTTPVDHAGIKNLAACLSSWLDQLGHKDELFALGDSAKQMARNIVAQSQSADRRHSDTNLAVVLVARTLDLASASHHSDHLLDRLYHFLPRNKGSIDVLIPSNMLFNAPGGDLSLAHKGDQETKELLSVLADLDYRNSQVVVR